MKLLDTANTNTKIEKSQKSKTAIRVASLSLYPDDIICPSRHNADCAKPCIVGSGRGCFDWVIQARQSKTDWYHSDRFSFLAQLKKELKNFDRLCKRSGVVGYVRLNVYSDIPYELKCNGSIPQSFPDLKFYDYTKRGHRLKNPPANYQLMFSYSAAPKYKKQVDLALKTDAPISVVFNGPMPDIFLGRRVIDGDKSDIKNLEHHAQIIGLKFKQNRIKRVDPLRDSALIITTDAAYA